jgi:hypothetical protein
VSEEIVAAFAAKPVRYATATAAIRWLMALPSWVPRPEMGVGDDGTISIEWDHNAKTLHVMFSFESVEAYFDNPEDNEEWEMSVSTDSVRVRHALRLIALHP